MGTNGYTKAAGMLYHPDECILEVGYGESTRFLAEIGPPVVTIDPLAEQWIRNTTALQGYAEDLLEGWTRPIGFAWLDGWDFPYTGVDYPEQKAAYQARGQVYGQEQSRLSHLQIATLIAGHARVIAFDDTWRTHPWSSREGTSRCGVRVPPATYPAPALAMDHPLPGFVTHCWLEADHPHHGFPKRGWDGKGGLAIPWLLNHGYTVSEYGLGLVVLEKEHE